MVYGAFTTSQSPHDGKALALVDSKTFEGKNKNQYFHHFSKPRIIEIQYLEFSPECHEALKTNPQYQKLAEAITETHKLDGPTKIGEPVMIFGYIKK